MQEMAKQLNYRLNQQNETRKGKTFLLIVLSVHLSSYTYRIQKLRNKRNKLGKRRTQAMHTGD